MTREIGCGVAVGGTKGDTVSSQSLRDRLRAYTKGLLFASLLNGGIFKEE